MSQIRNFKFGQIGWMPTRNNRLGYGTYVGSAYVGTVLTKDGKNLAVSLANKGWKDDQMCTVTTNLSDEVVAEILAYRKQYLATLEGAIAEHDNKDGYKAFLVGALAFLREAWLTVKGDGQVEFVIPEALGITGNRRASVLPFAVAFRRQGFTEYADGETGKVIQNVIDEVDKDWTPTINCIVEHLDVVADAAQISMIQTTENTDDQHRRAYSKQEQALIGFTMWDAGKQGQVQFKNVFGGFTGIVLHILCKLASLYPQLDIRTRVRAVAELAKGEPNPQYINVGKLTQVDMQEVQIRTNMVSLEAKNKERAKSPNEKDRTPLDRMYDTDIDEYLRTGKLREKGPKAMALTAASAIVSAANVRCLDVVISGIANNNLQERLDPVIKRAIGLNLIYSLDDNQYAQALSLINGIIAPRAVDPSPAPVAELVAEPTH